MIGDVKAWKRFSFLFSLKNDSKSEQNWVPKTTLFLGRFLGPSWESLSRSGYTQTDVSGEVMREPKEGAKLSHAFQALFHGVGGYVWQHPKKVYERTCGQRCLHGRKGSLPLRLHYFPANDQILRQVAVSLAATLDAFFFDACVSDARVCVSVRRQDSARNNYLYFTLIQNRQVEMFTVVRFTLEPLSIAKNSASTASQHPARECYSCRGWSR